MKIQFIVCGWWYDEWDGKKNQTEFIDALYELKEDQDEEGSKLLNSLSKIHRKISEEKRFISGEIKQLNYLTSRIVFFSFSIQILIYFLLQYFEVFSNRRLLK